MSKKYKETELLEQIKSASTDMAVFYQKPFVNYSGRVAGGTTEYSEIIAAYLLENFDLFDTIKPVTRKKSYRAEHRDGIKDGDKKTCREEEWLAKSMFGRTYDYVGEIADYQTPLKNSREDKGLGKIDLVARGNGTLSLIELKREDNPETLLRCVLEIYTYYKTINQDKLKKDFEAKKSTKIIPTVFVFKGSAQHKQLALPTVGKLTERMGVKVYLIENEVKVSTPREIVFDTETTGLFPEADRLVEIGCVELWNGAPTGRTWQCYINPERDVPEDVVKVHGLSHEFLKDKRKFAEVAAEFLEFIGDADLIAHNASFDLGFLNAELVRAGMEEIALSRVIDTLPLSRRKNKDLKKHTLDHLCGHYGIDTSHRKKHGALLDAELLAKVYTNLKGAK